MPIKKDGSGHRSVQVEVDIPCSPEAAWDAIATGPGVTSWFVPTTVETDANGKPVRVVANFGPGMESISDITEWDPPHRLAAESLDLGPGAPPVATEWIVEARDGGMCTVRVVHSLFASTDDWDNQLESFESGWPGFFRILRLYLQHFSGQHGTAVQVQARSELSPAEAWSRFAESTGFSGAAAGDHRRTAAGAPALAAHVERVGAAAQREDLLLRVDEPNPGVAHAFAMNLGGQTLLSLRIIFYGDQAAAAAAEHEPKWSQWLAGLFPPAPTT
ncbi:MAG: SRPBCC domain-containing protein [Planctomycetota bacterium]